MRKPILIGGLGLSLLLWLGNSLSGIAMEWSQDALVMLTLLGGGIWWLKAKPRSAPPMTALPENISPEAVQLALKQAEQMLMQLETEAPAMAVAFQAQLAQWRQIEPSGPLTGGLIGAAGVGKTRLYEHLMATTLRQRIIWHDTPHDTAIPSIDLLLWLITGDLTDSELAQLQTLCQTAHTVCLVLTKQDQHPPEVRQTLVNGVQQRVQNLIPTENVVAIAAAPQAIALRQHQADGTVVQTTTTPEPQLQALTDRLKALTTDTARVSLRRANQWRQLRQLSQHIHQDLNQVRRDRAAPVVERYQWLAAGAAIANPVAALDLLAAIAINAQMVMDLGTVYRHTLTLDQAQTATRELGALLLKLGAVELSTQTLSHLAKSSPLTYLAGSAIQGISAAYLTRIVGLSLIDYFAEQDPLSPSPTPFNLQRLGVLVQQWLTQTRRSDLLQSLGAQLPARVSLTSEG
ncbi:MAG: YcjF family protein [Cyanobacteria bacterium P01_G01_bin.54]